MNIKVQCGGLILLLILLFFYTRQRKLPLNTRLAFKRLLVLTIAAVTLDILSVVALTCHAQLPTLLVDLICKAYITMLIILALFINLYVCRDIYPQTERYHKFSVAFTLIGGIGVLISYFLPMQKSCDSPDQIYTYGPSVIVTYVFCLIFLTAAVILLWTQKKNIYIRRWEAVRTWLVLLITAAVIQFLHNELLLVSFAGCLGIMITYLKLENPENNLDHRSGLYNRNALRAYVSQLFMEKAEFAALGLVFPHFLSGHILSDEDDVLYDEIVDYLLHIKGSYAFRSEEDEILLIFPNPQKADEYGSVIKNRFEFGWGEGGQVLIKPGWIFLPSSDVLRQPDDILYLLRHARQNSSEYIIDDTIWIDEHVVEGIYAEKKVEQMIAAALEEDRVEVYYQPIYSLQEERFVSAEALVRIRDDEGKIIPPGLFIEIAEKNGMIMELGERVFESVCRFIKEKQPEKYGLHYIEVNLSGVQCKYVHLADNFIRIMEKYGVPPKMINLEITESASVGEKRTLLKNMNRLIGYGVRFSLDDFGTGQSNLNYIVDIPVDIVKFDRSMVVSYFENNKAKYVMDAAMHMIQGMQLPIVSEGIETKEQLETMRRLGISFIQGYYFSKPLPGMDFIQFLSDRQNQG